MLCDKEDGLLAWGICIISASHRRGAMDFPPPPFSAFPSPAQAPHSHRLPLPPPLRFLIPTTLCLPSPPSSHTQALPMLR